MRVVHTEAHLSNAIAMTKSEAKAAFGDDLWNVVCNAGVFAQHQYSKRGAAANDAPRAEPWVDGPAQLAIRKRFIEERYRLLPYLYAVAAENARTGDPLMRPLFYDYPDSLKSDCDKAMTFTRGFSAPFSTL